MRKNKNLPLNHIERNHSKISLFCSIICLFLVFFLICEIDNIMIRKPAKEAAQEIARQEKEAEKVASIPQVSTASVIAVGDNYYQEYLLSSGQSESGQWNYDLVYTNVSEAIQAADLAIVSQDSVFTNSHDSVNTYPFAVPTEIGDALVNAGFDVVASASDTIDDFGSEMIIQTLDYWKEKHPEISVLGIHESQEDADSIKITEVNGIKIALLNYTFKTSDSSLETGNEYMIDTFEQDKVATAVQKAKENSDCILFFAHWGNEDDTVPSEYQKAWATFLMQQGVDVIMGSHPHVLQPYGRMSDSQGNEMVIFYSLGNFVTGQEKFDELLGGMAKFTIQKTVQNNETDIQILTPTITPTVMHYYYDAAEYGPYFLSDYTDEIGANHSGRASFPEIFSVENLKTRFDEIMSVNVTPSTGTESLDSISATTNSTEDANTYDDEEY